MSNGNKGKWSNKSRASKIFFIVIVALALFVMFVVLLMPSWDVIVHDNQLIIHYDYE